MGRPAKPWYWEERAGWYVTVQGKRRKLAEGPKGKTKRAAEQEFHRLMLARGRVETEPSRMLTRDLFNLYLVAVEGEHGRGERTDKSLRQYKFYLVSAAEALGTLRATDMRPKDLYEWIDRKSWGQSSRGIALGIVRTACRWAKDAGYLQENPLVGLKVPQMRVREEIPTQEQYEKMARHARGECFRDLLFALRDTGCRPSEILSLTTDRVNLETGTWHVTNKTRRTTGEIFRVVHLTPAMVELTRRRIARFPGGHVFRNSEGGAWKEHAVVGRFRRLREKLGYGPECTAYAFRHMYITDALERGVNPATLAELVGHKSLNMIMRVYNKLRLRTDHLREAARLARPCDGPSSIAPRR